MTLIASKKQREYRFQKGDLIDSRFASELLGYKSPKQFQDTERLKNLAKDFEAVGCNLTTNLRIGGQRRFLRSEIDAFLSRLVETSAE